MTTYSTRALAIEVLGDDTKAATRTLRKFLRDDMGEGKAVVGKGGRYALDMTKPQVRALTKRFKAWETAQEAAKVARADALKALASNPDNSVAPDIEAETDDEVETVTGPTDEEIASMMAEGDDEAETDDEDIED